MEGSTAPLGQGKKCTGMSLSELLALGTVPRAATAEGARQPQPGAACPDPNRPRAAELGTVFRSYSGEGDHRSPQITAARLSPKPTFLLPGVAFARPLPLPRLRPPNPPGTPGPAERSAMQRASCRHGSLGGS